MQTKVAKFSFTVPQDSPVESERGQKVEKSFEYKVCENDTEAQQVITEKKWSVLGMVNDALKANARASSYQNALAPHKASEVSAEDIKDRMIRDYIRLGVPEDVARKQVDSLLAAKV